MKFLFPLTALLFSTQLFAANVELGKYTAVPKDYPSATAFLDLKADGSATIKVDAGDVKVNCVGTYKVEGNILSSHVNCDNPQVPEVNAKIDLTTVTPENLRSTDGVEVPAQFDLMGDDWYTFTLKKAD
ncbi:MAG: hypothetical protein ACXWQQ_16340 [Pseudobdellovibrio sp.]